MCLSLASQLANHLYGANGLAHLAEVSCKARLIKDTFFIVTYSVRIWLPSRHKVQHVWNVKSPCMSACCLCDLPQAEASNGDGATAVKTSGRISAVVSLLMSMGAELESDQPSGNASADRGAHARSGSSYAAAEHGADARRGSSEAADDDFDDFEEAEEGSNSSATAVTTGAAPDAGAPAEDAATADLETPDAASGRDGAEEEALEQLTCDGDEQGGASGQGMEEAAAAREASDGRSAESAVVEAPAVTVPVVGSSSTSTDIASLGSNGRRASGDWGARERCLQVRHPQDPVVHFHFFPVFGPVAYLSVVPFESVQYMTFFILTLDFEACTSSLHSQRP